MNLVSKYEMGQRLFVISRQAVERPPVPCHACDAGFVLLRGERYECPACKGKAQLQARGHGWVISNSGSVGKIAIDHFVVDRHMDWGDGEVSPGQSFAFVQYMLDTTGIGSGTVYNEPNVWPSREEAQAECDRRNARRAS